MKDVITKEHVFNHSIDSVWKAITKAEEISAWFIKADFKAEAGYAYTFEASEEQNCTKITGIVKQADPYTLIYTWVVQGTDTETTVSWVLEPLEKGTRLTLEHSGISGYPGDTAVAMFDSFKNGWNNCVTGLNQYLNTLVNAG